MIKMKFKIGQIVSIDGDSDFLPQELAVVCGPSPENGEEYIRVYPFFRIDYDETIPVQEKYCTYAKQGFRPPLMFWPGDKVIIDGDEGEDAFEDAPVGCGLGTIAIVKSFDHNNGNPVVEISMGDRNQIYSIYAKNITAFDDQTGWEQQVDWGDGWEA